MNYRLQNKTPGESGVTLKYSRLSERIIGSMLLLFGLFGILIGAAFLTDIPAALPSASLWGGGGLFLFVFGLMLLTQIKNPAYLVFNNAKGQLQIFNKKIEVEPSAFLPYQQLAGFFVRTHRRDQSVSYVVEMEKKDGAFWSLFVSGNQQKANDFLKTLQQEVVLSRTSLPAPSSPQPLCFTIATTPEGTRMEWKRRFTTGNTLLGFLAFVALGLLVYGARQSIDNRIITLMLGIGVGFLIITTLISLFYSQKASITIQAGMLHYVGPRTFLGKKNYSIPIENIESIFFNFSLTGSDTFIFIFQKGEKGLFQKINRGQVELSGILEALRLMTKIRKIDVGLLPIADKLRLEDELQKQLNLSCASI